jgi:hypothetical protein
MANPNPNTKGLKPIPKGVSGNPKGKPKGTLNSKTVIRKWLEMAAEETNPKTKRKVIKRDKDGNPLTWMDAMVVAQIKKAVAKNDTAAFNALLDRMEGRPKQTTDINLPTGAVVTIGGEKVDEE